MTKLFSIILRAAESTTETIAETTEAATEYVPVVTEYKDALVPIFTIIMAGIAAAILIGVAIAAFAYMKNRAGLTWMNALLYGIIGSFVGTYILPNAVYFLFGLIPSLNTVLTTKPAIPSAISAVLMIGGTVGAIILGMVLLKKALEKRHQRMDLGTAFVFALGFFAAALLINGQLSYSVEYVTYALSLNAQGFDTMVNAYIQSAEGTTVEEAVNVVKSMFLDVNAAEFVLNALIMVLQTVAIIAAAVAFYGIQTEKLERKWLALVILAPLVFYIPQVLAGFVEIERWIVFVAELVIAAVEGYVGYRLISEKLQEDWERFNVKKAYSENQEKRDEKPRMPKIVMPKIESDDIVTANVKKNDDDIVTPNDKKEEDERA